MFQIRAAYQLHIMLSNVSTRLIQSMSMYHITENIIRLSYGNLVVLAPLSKAMLPKYLFCPVLFVSSVKTALF
jgi:hypothetical protein